MVILTSNYKKTKQKRVKGNLERYIRHLVFDRLKSEEEVNLVAEEILRLPLKEQETEDFLVKYFLKAVKKGQFNQMNFVASISRFLKEYNPVLVVKLIDHLIEEIVYQLENNRLEER